jgi:hypothetical protein
MEWTGHVARMEGEEGHVLLVRKPEGKRLGIPRFMWMNNIKMNLRVAG